MRAALFCLLVVACGDNTVPAVERDLVAEIPATPNRELDVLFVVDDSASVADMQQNLGEALPSFFERLTAAIPGGLPDLHVGVITSDLGTATSTSGPAPPIGEVGLGGCAGTGKNGDLTVGQATLDDAFVSDFALSDGTRDRNYDGDLAGVVGQMIRVGSTGCGFEQPLAAMRTALDDNPNNGGFLRADAVLAVIFLMDEDDCSARDPALFDPESPENPLQSFRCTRFGVTCVGGGNTPDEMNEPGTKTQCGPSEPGLVESITPFRDFLLNVKDPRRVVVGTLVGRPRPFKVELRTINGQQQPALAHSCSHAGPDDMLGTADDQVADPGVRLHAFAKQFAHRFVSSSVCDDMAPSLAELAQVTSFALGTPCVAGRLADTDLETEGLQPDCIVEDIVDDVATPIPRCPASPVCWDFVTDLSACPLFEHRRLQITREAPADPATITRARCVTL